MHGHVKADFKLLASALSEAACSCFDPGVKLVVDESMYEYEGTTPITRFIPRKPHPNGLLNYCLSGEILVASNKIPIVLDFEPYTVENNVGPHAAMTNLLNRFKQRFPTVKPHLFVDAAFGSLSQLNNIIDKGISQCQYCTHRGRCVCHHVHVEEECSMVVGDAHVGVSTEAWSHCFHSRK